MLLVGILLVILSALTAYSSGCDYQRLESGHTMCVYPARNCPGKSLIRMSLLLYMLMLLIRIFL